MIYKPIIYLAFVLLLLAGNANAGEYLCDADYEILVTQGDSARLESICEASRKAIEFLSLYQLQPKQPIRITIVETEVLNEGFDAFGRYDSRSDNIELMSYQAISAQAGRPEMFDEPFDEVHYSGAVAHEVAHAVMQHNLMSQLVSPAPQEYLASATQLAVMPAERRQSIIQAMDVGPWQSGDAISDVYMAIAPGKFAVKSYLHLTTMEEPEAFIKLLLKSNWFYVYVP